jgi:15-cis-phytoene synthase
MQDAFAYCADLVRTSDRDRYIATLFAPAERRDALYALYAFNAEIARVRDVAREPLPGEIRLQWWTDVLNGERDGEASANPVAAALLDIIQRHKLETMLLTTLIDARRFDLYDEPMEELGKLEVYAHETSSALITLAAQILTGSKLEIAAKAAGTAQAFTAIQQSFPLYARRKQLFVPAELLARYGVEPYDIFAGRSSAGLNAAFAELRTIARRHLREAQQCLTALPSEALAAFLPLALVGPSLRLLDRRDAFVPAEISPWRRQWLIWRAARDPARIAA